MSGILESLPPIRVVLPPKCCQSWQVDGTPLVAQISSPCCRNQQPLAARISSLWLPGSAASCCQDKQLVDARISSFWGFGASAAITSGLTKRLCCSWGNNGLNSFCPPLLGKETLQCQPRVLKVVGKRGFQFAAGQF